MILAPHRFHPRRRGGVALRSAGVRLTAFFSWELGRTLWLRFRGRQGPASLCELRAGRPGGHSCSLPQASGSLRPASSGRSQGRPHSSDLDRLGQGAMHWEILSPLAVPGTVVRQRKRIPLAAGKAELATSSKKSCAPCHRGHQLWVPSMLGDVRFLYTGQVPVPVPTPLCWEWRDLAPRNL